MSDHIKEYTTGTGRYLEVVDGNMSMDSVAALLGRISISTGILAILVQLVALIFNFDTGIFSISIGGTATLFGIFVYSFGLTAFLLTLVCCLLYQYTC